MIGIGLGFSSQNITTYPLHIQAKILNDNICISKHFIQVYLQSPQTNFNPKNLYFQRIFQFNFFYV